MCLALYLAADRSLPLIPQREYPKDVMSSPTWPQESQRFQTAALRPEQDSVRTHFSHAHVRYAGSYEGCGCGFNFARQYPDFEDDLKHLAVARESVAELLRYVVEYQVREIYVCWFGDEAKPTVHHRTITPNELIVPDFFFREQELLEISHAPQ